MSIRLSHSAIEKFEFCNQAWKLHYKEGYRAKKLSSALPFGGALGKAFEYGLNKEAKDVPAGVVDIYGMFDYHWSFQHINDVLTNLQEYENMEYSKYDTDNDLLSYEESVLPEKQKAWASLRHKGHAI